MRVTAITAALTTAALVTLSSTAAYASGTVITVGGSSAPASVPVTMANTSDVTFDTDFAVPMTCTDSDIDGTINRGAAVSTGNTIGTIDSLTLSDCTATSLGFDVEVTMSGQGITVRNATGVKAGDPIPIDVQVDAIVTGTDCNFTVEGSVRGVLNPGSGSPDGTIELKPGYDLTIDTANGSPSGQSCGGEIYAGDLAQATGGDFDLTTSGGPINAGAAITVGGSSAPASVPVDMTNTSDVTFDTNYGMPFTCESAEVDLTINRGAAISTGSTIGTWSSREPVDCFMSALNFPVTWEFGLSDITVRNSTGVLAGDPVPLDLQVDATATGTGCHFTVVGSVQGVLNSGSGSPDGTIELQPGYDLTIDTADGSPSGSSCGGEIYAGDLAQATGGDFDLTTTGPNAGPINHS